MTQLVLDTSADNGVILPESRKGGYFAQMVPLSVDVEMVTGRLVRELRGQVWQIEYQYGYFTEEMKNRVISACRNGQRTPIECLFLPPNSRQLQSGRFWVTKFTYPKFYWSRPEPGGDSVPLWGDFSLALREVKPSD